MSSEANRGSLWGKVKRGLFMTHTEIIDRVAKRIEARHGIDESVLESLEESLIAADAGAELAGELVAEVRRHLERDPQLGLEELKRILRTRVEEILAAVSPAVAAETDAARPHVILMVGVNGVGKTTTAAKLAALHQRNGASVQLAAADTFRAAAVEQLELWGKRLGVPVIAHKTGADPAAVVFDAISSAKSRGTDVLIVDTAGRLHTKHNLMEELGKIRRIVAREIQGGPQETLLVLDAVTGQNGLAQAREFLQIAGISGIVLTKLDGTAKGGVVLVIARSLKLPVRYIGVGEQADDLLPFDAAAFAAALFE